MGVECSRNCTNVSSRFTRGDIEKDFTHWVTDAVLARLLREGVVLKPHPRTVFYSIGEPLWCHANALRGGKLYG